MFGKTHTINKDLYAVISYDVVHNMHAKYDMVKLEYNPMAFQNHKNIKT